jgi:BirA family biotin operon repressor/biotin-[acetyl-CoA-carboxylase] ligase
MIIGSDILYFDSLTSTNAVASQMLLEKKPEEGTVIRAGFQTAGKGQKGKSWESGKNENLLFSVILYPSSLRPDEQFLLSMAISLGISDFLENHIPRPDIKWPNDIYAGDKKIAGILIENSIMDGMIEYSVAGIGININQKRFSSGIRGAVSLGIITGREYDTDLCLLQLLSFLDIRYKQLLYGDREAIRNDYFSNLYRAGEWHSYSSEGVVFRGAIRGVSSSGILTVEKEGNEFCGFSFKEIQYLH